jgi:hypothetical protein
MRRGIEVSEKILDPTRVYCNRIVTLDVFQENCVQKTFVRRVQQPAMAIRRRMATPPGGWHGGVLL